MADLDDTPPDEVDDGEMVVDADMLDALLGEYRAARARIDESAAAIFERRAADMECAKGCASCCVDGLTVLEVEAAEISLHAQTRTIATPAPPPGGCAFLDANRACTIYDARPMVCRTHGLPLRMPKAQSAPPSKGLRIVDDVSVCELNFTNADYNVDDVLDAERVQMLLTVVNTRFCSQLGIEDASERTPLAALADDLAGDGD